MSTIVATLLIILLTLVAVGIIWVVIRNIINQGAEQVSLGKFTLNLEIKNVAIDPATPSNINVKIKRNPGAGEISGLNFIIDDGDTTEVVKMVNFSLNELEERTINLSLTKITNSSKIVKVSVAPIFRLESGKDVTGDVKDDYEMPKTSGTTVSTGCLSGSECNDGNGCTTDSCNSGTCSHISITSCTNSDGCCPNGCTVANDNDCASVCGNGIREGSEGCDDGDISSGDGCSASCVVESGWSCNTATPNVCTNTVVCGDGIREGSEGCDDGDTSSGDGCSSTCTVESGYTCNTATPNVCTLNAVCGNGIREGSEGCDDGDTSSGDGCSSTCTVESGYTCNTATPNVCTLSTPAWQTGMVSWWRFNGNANDYTGRNNGTVSGATLTSTNCKSGQCYSFDGSNDYINVGNKLDLRTQSWTYSLWLKGTSSARMYILTKGASAGDHGVRIETYTTQHGAAIFGALSDYEVIYGPNIVLNNGNWHNIAVVFDRTGNAVWYTDGVAGTPVDISSYSGENISSPDNFLISDDHADFNGLIDEVMVFNRSLSSSEVQQIYNYNYP